MNYESIVKKPNPFNGLSVKSRQRLVIYLCYVAMPTMTSDEVRQRWGEVLSADDWPLAHEAMDLIDEIKRELLKRKRHRFIMCMVMWTTLVALCIGICLIMSWKAQQTERRKVVEEERQKKGKELKRKEAEEADLKQREAYAARLKELEEAREEARRKRVKEQRKAAEEVVRKQREEKERIRKAQEKARMAKASAESAKQDMRQQCNNAKSAGAKEYAITEWNNAVGKWNVGDDRFRNEDYGGASALYNQAGSLFVKAERISQSRRAAKLTAELSELQVKASALVEESDKWWKWSIDDSALLEMGNAINKSLAECENVSSFSVTNRNELEKLLVRCYELAANEGNEEAYFQLFLLYGGESEATLDTGIVIEKDKDRSLTYLKRAADKGHPVAKKIYGDILLKGTDNNRVKRRVADRASWQTRGSKYNTCSECGGKGYAQYVSWYPTFTSKSAYHKEVRYMKCKKCGGSGRVRERRW